MTNPTLSIAVFIVVMSVGQLYIRRRYRRRVPDDLPQVEERRREAVRRLHHELARRV